MHTRYGLALALATFASLGAGLAGCTTQRVPPDEHAGHDTGAGSTAAPAGGAATASMSAGGSVSASQSPGLPAGAADVAARLAASPRHAEWVTLAVPQGPGANTPSDSVRSYVVYPERRTKAPVVIVVHEIFGLSPWVRGVADQLAADGFIAIAPELMTMKRIPGSPLDPNADSARAAIRTLDTAFVHRQLDVVARWGMAQPAALPRYGIVGYCWGGSTSWQHAVHSPTLGAAVVYYGGSPPAAQLSKVVAPVLGLYGENDARVNSTIPSADTAMKAMGKSFEHHIFPGAGHGFLRAQDGQSGANLAATQKAWPLTVAFFRRHLGG